MSTQARCRNPRQRAIRADQIGQRHVEREDRRRGPLVTEHLLLRRLCERQIAQISADDGVDVCVDSGSLHRHPTHLSALVMRAAAGVHGFPRASRQPDQAETDASDRQEDPVVRRDMERHVADVVDVQQVMIDHALNEVEETPAQDHLSDENRQTPRA